MSRESLTDLLAVLPSLPKNVKRIRFGSIELELFQEHENGQAIHLTEPIVESEEQREERLKKEKAQFEALLFASSEG